MSQFSTKNKSREWFFLGYGLTSNDPKLLELLKEYKVKAEIHSQRGTRVRRLAVFVNSPYPIGPIRKRLWGHRRATHSNWLAESPRYLEEKNND